MALQDRFKSTEKRKKVISVYLDEALLATLDSSVQQWQITRNEAIIRILRQYFKQGEQDEIQHNNETSRIHR